MFTRYGIGLVAGAVVTVVLLYIMQAVIALDKNPLNEAPQIRILEFVRLIEDVPVVTKERDLEPPPPVDELPPEPIKMTSDTSLGTDVANFEIEVPTLDLGGWGLGDWSQDGEMQPWFTPEPEYPTVALQRGIEGYVVVKFDVTEEGTVENPVILEADPPGIFDRSALRAAKRFKFRAKVVNNEPVRVTGVKYRLIYELDEKQ
ncbi:MAG: energy transducer TonB [Gammaproteobacteria bacterium]|nr:energy transducer TonB [Gammaproteobacteria bacterium]